MGMVRTASIIALLMAGTAMAASTVTLELEIGGDPHATDLQAYNFVPYTPGSTDDNQQVDISAGVLNWAVRPIVTGDALGIANVVCDLELHVGADDTGPIAGADFYSSYHDAAGSCADFTPPIDPLIGHCGRDATGQVNIDQSVCTPCYASAAFAFIYPDPFYPGEAARMIDKNYGGTCGVTTNPNGGPNLSVFLYPSCEPGKLYGIGAGYPHYKGDGGLTTKTKPYVGLYPNPNAQMPQSPVPLIEGQIDLTGLTEGTYTLKVIPGTGINALRGDIDPAITVPAFAVPADTTIGDTITFDLVPGGDLHLASAASRCNHGGTDYDLPLNLSGTPSPEPRHAAQNKIVLTYSEDVTAADGTIDAGQEIVATLDGSPQAISQIDVNGPDIVVTFSGLPTVGCLVVNATGLQSATSGAMQTGDTDVYVNLLTGDVDFSGAVDTLDLSALKIPALNPPPVDGTNFQFDVNSDGAIDTLDLSMAKVPALTGTLGVCSVDVD